MPRTVRKPSYTLHKPTGQARVRIGGRDHYLGEYGSPESRAKYDDLIAEWFDRSDVSGTTMTVDDLVIRFMAHARLHYRKDGKETSEVHCLQTALRYVVRMFGKTLARNFGPKSLKAIRTAMIRDGHCRTSINQHASRIRRVFGWAVAEELLGGDVLTALQSVRGLEAGRSDAVEMDPVKPVPLACVEAVMPFLTEPVRGLVEFQLATGCRPSEAILLRGCDITMPEGSAVWEYRPASHKLQHKRKPRVIYLGPRAQAIVRRFLTTDLKEYLFRPQDVRKRATSAERQPGERYNVGSYRAAVMRACEDAFDMPKELRRFSKKVKEPERTILLRKSAEWRDANCWHPNQLRHTFATQARREAGIDAARVLLGHSKLQTTEIYAEQDGDKARSIIARIG